MKNDEALNIVRFIALRWKTRNFLNVPTNRKGAVRGAVMRHKQHILFLPKIDVFDPLVGIIVRLRVNNVPVCSVCWPSHNNTAVNGRPWVTLQAETLMVPLRRLLYFLNSLLWSGTTSSPFLRENGKDTAALISCWTQYIQLSTLTLQAQPGADYSMRVNATILRAVAATTDTNEATRCHARQPAPAQMDSQATAGTIC